MLPPYYCGIFALMNTLVIPTSDIFIRYLFGSKGNEALLCDFINAHLVDSGFEPVERVTIENPFTLKQFQYDKESVLDVRAEAKDKRIFNVEIQSTRQKAYVSRSLYYWAKLYQGQLKEGEDYAALSPVICINILDFSIFDAIVQPHTCFILAEKDHPEYLLTGDLQLHFYELPKYRQTLPYTSQLEKWACFFQCEGRPEKEETMEILLKDNPVLTSAHQKYIHFTEDKELRMAYEAREKYQRDRLSMLSYAEEKGMKKGRKEGIYQVAAEMKRSGMAAEHIQQYTKLSLQEIDALD